MVSIKDWRRNIINKQYTWILIVIIISPLYFWHLPHFWRTQDEKCYFWLMERITQSHSLTINYPAEIDRSFLWDMPKVKGKQGVTLKYPIGQSLILSGARLIGGYQLVFFIVPMFGLFSIVLLYKISFLITRNVSISSYASILLAISPSWLIHSRSILSDIPAASLLLAFSYYLLKVVDNKKSIYFHLAGWSLGLSIIIRYPGVIILLPAIYFIYKGLNLSSRMRSILFLKLIAPSILCICFIMFYNYRMFGNPFTTGYGVIGEQGFQFLSCPTLFLNYLIITLTVIPGGGLFLIFTLSTCELQLRNRFIYLANITMIFIIFYSCWTYLDQLSYAAEDLLVFGSRLILPVLPILAFFTAFLLIQWQGKIKVYLAWGSLGIFFVISLLATLKVSERIEAYSSANQFVQQNTEVESLILLKSHWFKIIWPHFGDRRFLALENNELSGEYMTIIQGYIALDKAVYIVQDPYVRFGLPESDTKGNHNAVYDYLKELGYQRIITAETNKPFEITLFRLTRLGTKGESVTKNHRKDITNVEIRFGLATDGYNCNSKWSFSGISLS